MRPAGTLQSSMNDPLWDALSRSIKVDRQPKSLAPHLCEDDLENQRKAARTQRCRHNKD